MWLHTEPKERTYALEAEARRSTQGHASLTHALTHFAPVGLADLEAVALQRRFDTKLVLREEQLTHTLAQLSDDYEVLYIEGRRIHRYHTLYFDTPEYALYHQHHNGQRSRYKVRTRKYEDSGLAFLEVKHKTNQDITIKERQAISGITPQINARGKAFLATIFPYTITNLFPTLENHFQRVTLMSKHHTERLTIDVGISFRIGQLAIALPGVAIAEIKHASHLNQHSEFVAQLRLQGVRPMRFSKYCIGISLLAPQVKRNHFKPQLSLLDKILQETGNGQHPGLWVKLSA